jgi:DNA-directed RNA polymerase subunit H
MAKKTVVVKRETVSKKKSEMKKPKSKRVKRDTGSKMIVEHILVPVHTKLSEKEASELLKFHNITIKELPKIYVDDPAIRHLEVKENDIIKIVRHSPTSGKSVFYRGVIDE